MHTTNDGKLEEEIKRKNNQRRQAIRQLNSMLFSCLIAWDITVSKENKHKIFPSIVKTLLRMEATEEQNLKHIGSKGMPKNQNYTEYEMREFRKL